MGTAPRGMACAYGFGCDWVRLDPAGSGSTRFPTVWSGNTGRVRHGWVRLSWPRFVRAVSGGVGSGKARLPQVDKAGRGELC